MFSKVFVLTLSLWTSYSMANAHIDEKKARELINGAIGGFQRALGVCDETVGLDKRPVRLPPAGTIGAGAGAGLGFYGVGAPPSGGSYGAAPAGASTITSEGADGKLESRASDEKVAGGGSDGAAIFQRVCASCHKTGGSAPPMTTAAKFRTGILEVENGEMPPKTSNHRMSASEKEAVLAYLKERAAALQ